jgi:long-chain fatty acid transport protein
MPTLVVSEATMADRRAWRMVAAGMVAVGVLALLPTAAIAGGFSNPDFGVRRVGMFAVTARPDDVTAIFHNPAGLTLLEGTQFYHAQSWFVMDLGMRLYDSKGQLKPNYEIKPTLNVGAIPFIGFASDCGTRDFRMGFGIYAPNAFGASLPEDEPTRYHATQALFLSSRATLAVAYKFTEKLRIGAAISLVNVYMMKKQYMGKNMLPVNSKPNDPKWDGRFLPAEQTGATDMLMELDGMAWTWAADLGVLFHPIPTLRIGLAFSGGSPFDLKGDVSLTDSTCRPGDMNCKLSDHKGVKETTTHTTGMLIPFELKAGFNWEFVKDFEVGADVYYWHYQVLQNQHSALAKPLKGVISELDDPKNYGKSWAWNIGMMYRVVPSLELMIGFQMDFTPIPAQTYTLENPSTDQKGISMGLRWQIDDRWRVGIAYVRNWFNFINVQTSISQPPTNVKGHGSNNEFAFDFGYRF